MSEGLKREKIGHSSGPWYREQLKGPVRIMSGGTVVATIKDFAPDRDQRIADANARLIAAAPDLASALAGLLGPGIGTYADGEGLSLLARSEDTDTVAALAAARAALAKAGIPCPS